LTQAIIYEIPIIKLVVDLCMLRFKIGNTKMSKNIYNYEGFALINFIPCTKVHGRSYNGLVVLVLVKKHSRFVVLFA
jgi:hypothetical protein